MLRAASLLGASLLFVACDTAKNDAQGSRRGDETTAASSAAPSAPARGEPPSGWSLLAPAGAGYSVFVPGTAQKLETGLSEMHAAKRPSGSVYSAMCMDPGTKKQNDETFEGVRRGKIGDRKVLSAKPVDDARGVGERLAIELETTAGRYVSNELILRGTKRVCSFSALVPATADEAADVERFFDSARFEDG